MRLVRNHFLAKLVVILENDLYIHQLELNVVFMLVPKSAPSKVWLHNITTVCSVTTCCKYNPLTKQQFYFSSIKRRLFALH